MNPLVADVVGSGRNMRAPAVKEPMVSGATFWLYMYFVVENFLHFSSRIPAYGFFRPTLLLVAIITVMLVTQAKILKVRQSNSVFMAILALLGYLVASLPLVEFPGSVVRQNLPNFVKAIVFFYFTAFIIDSPRRLKIFLFVFVTTQVLRVMEPLFLHFTTGYWGDSAWLGNGEMTDRLAGAPADVVNPNGLGFIIVTVIPYLHYLVFPKGFGGKVLYLCLLPLLLYALILTQSRGAFLSLLVVFAIILRDSRRKGVLVVVAVALSIAGWSSMSPMQRDRYLSLVGKSETANAKTSEGRIEGLFGEFEVGLSRPIVGHGVGTTQEAKFHAGHGRMVSHNLYAELFIEIGIIGALFFVRFLMALYRSLIVLQNFFRTTRISSNSLSSRLARTLTTVFILYAVYSVNYWGLSQYYWYLFGGLVFSFYRLVTRSVIDQRAKKLANSGTTS